MLVGKPIVANQVFKGCIIQVGGHELVADLILLDMQDFNAILGMDWLFAYRAKIDCFRKEVIFQILDGSKVSFIGNIEYFHHVLF